MRQVNMLVAIVGMDDIIIVIILNERVSWALPIEMVLEVVFYHVI